MRRFLFHLHSWMGLIAGLCLIVIGLTGSALVFRQEIESLVMPQRVLALDQSAERLHLDALVARLEDQLRGYEPVGWRPARSRGRNDAVFVAPHAGGESKVLWVDPARGTIHGTPISSSQTFTGWLLEFHYTLLGGHVGTLLAGFFAALLCLLGISGVWIYRNFWKSFFLLRWNLSARILFSDLHKMVGISSVGFNLILGFTGAYWNLTHIIGHLLNGPDPQPPKINGRVRAGTLSLEGLLIQARTHIPGFEWTYVSLPARLDEPIIFYGRLENQHALRGEFGSSVTFNSQTGALEGLVDIRTTGFRNQFVDSFMPLHYGTFGALPVKILWCVGGLAPGTLAITGYVLWWKRRRSRRAENREPYTIRAVNVKES